MTSSTRAIILKRQDVHEYDRLYTVYTQERGKLILVGKGTRRPKAKLAASLEPYSVVDLTIAQGRAIDRITFAQLEVSGTRFAASWQRSCAAAFLVSCVEHLTKEERDDATFDLLRDALDAAAHDVDVAAAFVLRFLYLLGYAPRLDRCVDCRRNVPDGPAVGVPERGGVICGRCRMRYDSSIVLTATDRAVLHRCGVSFCAEPLSAAPRQFALAQLAVHLPAPLPVGALTDPGGPGTVGQS